MNLFQAMYIPSQNGLLIKINDGCPVTLFHFQYQLKTLHIHFDLQWSDYL